MFYTDYSAPFGEAGEGVILYLHLWRDAPRGCRNYRRDTPAAGDKAQSPVTTDSPDILREESLGTNFALTFSYADRITESLSAGINGKMIRMVLGRESGSSYAVDLGMQYLLPFEPIPTTLGVAIQNVGPGISFIDENQADPLPRFLRIGTSMSLYRAKYHHIRLVSGVTAYIDKLAEDEHELTVDLDRLNAEREEKLTQEQLLSDRGVGIRALEWRHLQKNLGLEYWLGGTLAFRVGYKSEPGVNLPDLTDHITAGVGAQWYLFNIDFTIGPNFGPNRSRLYETTLMFIF